MKFPKMKIKKINWLQLGLELFVVFLGVTAGFLLNNWSVNRHESKIEQKYLEGFSEDIKNNISELKSAIQVDSIWIAQAGQIIKIINESELPIDSTNAAISLISNLNSIETNVGTYEDIINSGNLNLIKPFQLKSHIIKYQNVIAKAELLDGYLKEFFNNFLLPFLVAETDVMKTKFKDPETITSPKYSNLLGIYFSFINQRTAVYKEFLEESLSLSQKLEQSLNN